MQTPTPGFPSPSSQQGEHLDITFQNNGSTLVGLGFINGLLKIATLGIYSFWAKTEVRKRIWSFIRFNGEPLEYTGTGKELFLGFLVVLFGVLLPIMLVTFGAQVMLQGYPAIALAVIGGVYALIFFLIGVAIYRATRYRLTRTRWRGIRGNLMGNSGRYGWTHFWTLVVPFGLPIIAALLVLGIGNLMLLPIATQSPELMAAMSENIKPATAILGIGIFAALWTLPWRANLLQRLIVKDMKFGDRQFLYTGTPWTLYKNYGLAWIGTFGVIVGLALLGYILNASGIAFQTPQGGDDETISPASAIIDGLLVLAFYLVAGLLIGLITSWYRAAKMNYFASSTHYEGATFSASATGGGVLWLTFSNWLLSTFAILLAVFVGIALAYAFGVMPEPAAVQPVAAEGAEAIPQAPITDPVKMLLFYALIALPATVLGTAALTFAQLRSARYWMSRLKLNGPVPVTAISQSADAGLRRGEGLAQAFDVDAF
jgi:uncharacterized membrane protein YjgN (DUF898 family)